MSNSQTRKSQVMTYSFGTFEVETVVGDQHFAFHGSIERTDVNDIFI